MYLLPSLGVCDLFTQNCAVCLCGVATQHCGVWLSWGGRKIMIWQDPKQAIELNDLEKTIKGSALAWWRCSSSPPSSRVCMCCVRPALWRVVGLRRRRRMIWLETEQFIELEDSQRWRFSSTSARACMWRVCPELWSMVGLIVVRRVSSLNARVG